MHDLVIRNGIYHEECSKFFLMVAVEDDRKQDDLCEWEILGLNKN